MREIVFIAGLLCDEALWQAQVNALAADYRVRQFIPLGADNVAALAAKLLQNAPPRFTIIALSMGGYVAMEMMRQAPERVEALALFSTNARADDDEKKRRRSALIELALMGKFKGVTPQLLPQLINKKHLDNPAITSTILQMAEHVGRDGFIAQQRAIMNRPDSRETLRTITCPTLFAVGVDDGWTPPALAEEMAGLVKDAKLEFITDSGHLPPLEQPHATTEIIKNWLQSH